MDRANRNAESPVNTRLPGTSQVVHAWAFERVATAALTRGDVDATRLALALSAHLGNVDEAPGPDADRDAARALMVTIEEFFVLTHDTALGEAAHENLERHLRDELEAALRSREAVQAEHWDAITDQMARDISQAVSRHVGGAPSEADLDRLREFARVEETLDEVDWLGRHQFLYEELACDLIATELTLEHFRDLDPAIDTRVVLPAILMALHHLTSLEYLRTIVDADDGSSAGQTLGATMVRKSVWRDVTRNMYDAQSASELGRMYVDVTQEHVHKLGDQVRFIVPTTWRDARTALAARQTTACTGEPTGGRLRNAVASLAGLAPTVSSARATPTTGALRRAALKPARLRLRARDRLARGGSRRLSLRPSGAG